MPGVSAPDLAANGVAVFAPDQRGFGATEGAAAMARHAGLVDDARDMALLLRKRYPHVKLIC